MNAMVDGEPAAVEQEYDEAVTQAAMEAETLCFTGDSGAPYMYSSGIQSCRKRPGYVIPTIKPRSNDEIIKKIRQAEEAKAIAVASDIDAATLINMRIFGQPVGPKTAADIREIAASTELPLSSKVSCRRKKPWHVPMQVRKVSSSAIMVAASSMAWPVRLMCFRTLQRL